MSEQTLTAKSAKNSIVALVFYAVNLVLQFISRRIFIEYLGEDILGLNTTISSILQFLNIAELGIGSAVGYTLYKPLYENDRKTINEIVSLQGWLYKKIASFIIAASAVLLLFFPLIFEKTVLPLWYSYATFGALLFSSLLGYFVNYKQILLSADQKEYKIQYSYKSVVLVKLILQIVFISLFENGYVWWIILEVLFAVLAALMLSLTVKRTYPYLTGSPLTGKELLKQHPVVWTKTKQLFFHKLGGVVLTKLSPIVIYGIATLELVAIYGNYMLIISGVTSLIIAIFSSMNAGVGNLVARGDKVRIMRVFDELFSIRFFITAVICFCSYTLTQPFMEIWMGPDLLLDNQCLILFISIMFINLNRLTPDAFINAYGLFNDIWSPVVESLLNLVLSIVLGSIWGLKGVLMGILISLILVIFCWKQYFLFKKGFKENLLICVKLYVKHILIAAAAFPIISFVYERLIPSQVDGMFSWVIHAFAYASVAVIILGVLMLLFTSGMRAFARRVQYILKKCH